ncbi:hypothetical protein OH807_40915 [Kitasatospora sp. NBC_01560]|uniref:hypothetical protein n=1 Tax=Kitasatospora sp. NBC_01560 TaxID=2975965 RepID=UPI003868E5D8
MAEARRPAGSWLTGGGFDCTLGEFLARLLTDVGLGFAPSHLLDSHHFESWDR